MEELTEKPKILIVDDARENIDILRAILSDYRCLAALDGKTALKIARSDNKPDLILLDIVMPGMDGYEVLRQLKEDEETNKIPVIFLTGRAEEEDEVKGLNLGAVDYIKKPISAHVVRARVKTHLNLKLALEKIEVQKKELINAAKLKEDVEHITRHDIKSPLTVIIGNMRLLIDTENFSENIKRMLLSTEKAAYRILDMVNRTLDLYKMEKGNYKILFEPVDVVELLRHVQIEVERSLAYKNVSINVFYNYENLSADHSFVISGEKFLFHTLLANLISNAVEASPKGGEVEVILESNDKKIIKIHNQGAVPPEIRDRFFEKYVTSGKKRGTGLGTYSAKLITETMNGAIEMRTSEEDGTWVIL
ncbi:MAG: response regulator, partial [Calditrichaeota bacterium]|nr:response regulator [Calditrichota bacterium]